MLHTAASDALAARKHPPTLPPFQPCFPPLPQGQRLTGSSWAAQAAERHRRWKRFHGTAHLVQMQRAHAHGGEGAAVQATGDAQPCDLHRVHVLGPRVDHRDFAAAAAAACSMAAAACFTC
eukprot:COSAG01_NODE_880_length_12937_cov_265.873968_6_plen_121_part_00